MINNCVIFPNTIYLVVRSSEIHQSRKLNTLSHFPWLLVTILGDVLSTDGVEYNKMYTDQAIFYLFAYPGTSMKCYSCKTLTK